MISRAAAKDSLIRETKKTNLQLQFLPSVGSFFPFLLVHLPHPLSSAPLSAPTRCPSLLSAPAGLCGNEPLNMVPAHRGIIFY